MFWLSFHTKWIKEKNHRTSWLYSIFGAVSNRSICPLSPQVSTKCEDSQLSSSRHLAQKLNFVQSTVRLTLLLSQQWIAALSDWHQSVNTGSIVWKTCWYVCSILFWKSNNKSQSGCVCSHNIVQHFPCSLCVFHGTMFSSILCLYGGLQTANIQLHFANIFPVQLATMPHLFLLWYIMNTKLNWVHHLIFSCKSPYL